LLFHLERYRIAAPKLLAYGQRRRSGAIEAFVLHEAPAADVQPLQEAIFDANPFRCDWLLECLAELLNKLHESGCEARTVNCFAMDGDTIVIPDPERLVFRRRLSARQKRDDRNRVIRSMRSYCGREELARFAELLENDTKR
jgi:hypothetical protein